MHPMKILTRLHEVQADLNICWAHMSKDTFSYIKPLISSILVLDIQSVTQKVGTCSAELSTQISRELKSCTCFIMLDLHST